MSSILVYGSGMLGQVVRALLVDCKLPFAGFIDDFTRGNEVIGNLEDLLASPVAEKREMIMAIGYRHLEARLARFDLLKSSGFRFATVVHPTAYVSSSAHLGEGAIVMARAIVDVSASIGDAAVLWPGANVSHDCDIGRNTFLSPGSVICGCARIGASCFIGAGAVVTDHVDVPAGSFVRAGTCYSGGPLTRWHPPDSPPLARPGTAALRARSAAQSSCTPLESGRIGTDYEHR